MYTNIMNLDAFNENFEKLVKSKQHIYLKGRAGNRAECCARGIFTFFERFCMPRLGGRVCIYALVDENDIPGYIGATTRPQYRFTAHIVCGPSTKERRAKHGKKPDKVVEWVASVISRGAIPRFRVLAICKKHECVAIEQAWIAKHADTVVNTVRDRRTIAPADKYTLSGVTDEQIKLFRRAAKDAGYKTWQKWLLSLGNRESSSY
jgi:hypothetical protein